MAFEFNQGATNPAFARDYQDHTNPEKAYPNLVKTDNFWNGMAELRKANGGKRHDFTCLVSNTPLKELCWACSWTNRNQMDDYDPRVKIVHTERNGGWWQIGPDWLLKDKPNDASLGNDYITQTFIRNQPGLSEEIPVIKTMQLLSKPTDKIQLCLTSRVEGVALSEVWDTTPEKQKLIYREQLTEIFRHLRSFTSPIPRNVDGGKLDDIVFDCNVSSYLPKCKTIGDTTDEWFDNIAEELRVGLSVLHETKDPIIIEEKLQELKDNFPNPEPYVLTHGNLNLGHIIVKDGKIQAILGWDFAGYYPWWVERFFTFRRHTRKGQEVWEPLWANFGGDIEGSHETFCEKIYGVYKVIQAYNRCPLEHHSGNELGAWMRPIFCDCKPFRGHYRWKYMAVDTREKRGHKISDPSDGEDNEDETLQPNLLAQIPSAKNNS